MQSIGTLVAHPSHLLQRNMLTCITPPRYYATLPVNGVDIYLSHLTIYLYLYLYTYAYTYIYHITSKQSKHYI